MDYIEKLNEKRNALIAELQKALESAKNEKRSLNSVELKKFDELKTEVESITQSINAAKQEDELRKLVENVPLATEKKVEPQKDEFRKYLLSGEMRTLTVGDDGAIVPDYFTGRVIESLVKDTKVYQMVNETVTNSANVVIPVFTDYALPTFSTEILVTDLASDTTGGFKSKKEIKPLPLRKRVSIGDFLIKTNGIDVEAHLMKKFAEMYSAVVDNSIYNGDGTDDFLGVFNAGSGITAVSTIGANIHPDDAFAIGTEMQGYANVANLSMHMHPNTLKQIITAKTATGGDYLMKEWQLSKTIAGIPVVLSRYAPDYSAVAGSPLIVIGDFKSYEVARVGSIEIDRVKDANKGVWNFIATMYIKGIPGNTAAFRVLKIRA